jgi:hypothetical protein
MSLNNYLSGLDASAWAALEGWAAWTALVKPGNRIRWSGSTLMPRKANKQIADTPQLELTTRVVSDDLGTETSTFGTLNDEGNGTGLRRVQCNIRMKIVSGTLRNAEYDPVVVETIEAFAVAGPRLGLSYVVRVGPITARTEEKDRDEAAGTLQLITTLDCPVYLEFSPGELAG